MRVVRWVTASCLFLGLDVSFECVMPCAFQLNFKFHVAVKIIPLFQIYKV